MTTEEERTEMSLKEAKNRLLDHDGSDRYKTERFFSGMKAEETTNKEGVFVLTSMDDLVVSGFWMVQDCLFFFFLLFFKLGTEGFTGNRKYLDPENIFYRQQDVSFLITWVNQTQ